MTTTETVEVEALPQDLPQHMEIDVSVLENFGDALYVRDLVAPPNVTILTDPDDLLVVAQAPSEEVIPEGAPLEAGAEVVEEEAEEAEEAEEGEEAEGGEAAEEGGE
jgi:large subunit ribosomal protein L25